MWGAATVGGGTSPFTAWAVTQSWAGEQLCLRGWVPDGYPYCSRCDGKRWVRYFSEKADGDFEEDFGLCPCNHRPEAARGTDYCRDEPEGVKDMSSEKLASRRIGVIELRVELW